MKRRAIEILLALWLWFCLLTLLVWAGSHYQRSIFPDHLIGRWSYRLDSRMTGKVSIQLYHDFPAPIVGPPLVPGQYTGTGFAWMERLPTGYSSGAMGFFVGDEKNLTIDRINHAVWVGWTFYLSVPYWFAWIMWLPLAVYFDRWRKERGRLARAKRGLCVNCGYDLRATPLRCPECGTATAAPAPSSSPAKELV